MVRKVKSLTLMSQMWLSRACIIGGGVYRGSSFGANYFGKYFFGDFVKKSISYLTFASDGSKKVKSIHKFHETRDAVQDISFDHHGNLWYIGADRQNKRKLFRIKYAGASGNKPPQITSVLASSRQGAEPPFPVTFVGTAVDMDSLKLAYTWDFGDGSPFAMSAIAKHIYTKTGAFRARLFVSDGVREVGSEVVEVRVGSITSVTIASPAHNMLFKSDQAVAYHGSAFDPKYGDLTSTIMWKTDFIHDKHTHPYGVAVKGEGGVLAIPHTGTILQQCLSFWLSCVAWYGMVWYGRCL